MAKKEDRPVDSGIAALRGKPEAEVVEWWKQRFALIAGIPTEVARAGALLPQMRELSRVTEEERRALTRARIKAFVALPPDQQQLILAARKLADQTDPELAASDDAVADPIAREIPEAQAFAKRT